MKRLHCFRTTVVLIAFFVVFVISAEVTIAGPAQARTITVGPGAGYDYNAIQAGINAASDGDTVLVAPGEYVVTAPVTFRGKAITVRSQAGPEVTKIRMSTPANPQEGSVFSFENGETNASILEGFTITGGRGSWRRFPKGTLDYNFFGGGIVCSGSSPTIVACVITGNTAVWAGGGFISEIDAAPTLIGCTISRNSSREGGGIANGILGATVLNCTITGNSASGGYGGGGVQTRSGSAKVTNSIVWGNTAPSGPQVATSFGGTVAVSYSDIQGNWPGSGNIDADPFFADPSNGDYHLKSQAGRWEPKSQTWVQDNVTSPCIDRASPDSDWTLELWPHGKRANMGTYGGTPQASMSLSNAGSIADLNTDNAVNFQDFIRFSGSWQTQQALLCEDLNRNGLVDFSDLVVFAANWLGEVKGVGPLVYWKLDETEGTIAYDSAGQNVAFLIGGPVWQPAAGRIGGALAFDGVDDYAFAQRGLNPADCLFSIFAWVEGGAPGDVVISQADGIGGSGETWLGIEPSSGMLMSGLVSPSAGRSKSQPLKSQSVITDGQWHHVGFVWDGARRYLYVDGVEVAKDTAAVAPLKSATGGLYLGAGKSFEAGTFWLGLLDDVRIYNRALDAAEVAELAH